MSPELTHGSLFAGIGGFDLGFERCGIRTVWEVELDNYCRQVLQRHFPAAKRWADIRECGAHNLDPVDIISGGFPCQDISNAGRRVGIDGDRSGLWSEFARIVGELRPRYVCVENVAALLGRGMGRVLGDLASLGYDAEWDCLRASDVGAPHLRERVWIVAYPRRGAMESSRGVGCGASSAAPPLAAAFSGSEVPHPAGEGWGEARPSRFRSENGAGAFSLTARSDWWAVEPSVGRVAHGIPRRVDRLKGLGNACVPQITEYIGRFILIDSERKP